MSMLNLVARVCRLFGEADLNQLRTVQKVKEGQARDVVTALDFSLHEAAVLYAQDRLTNCRILSEEGDLTGVNGLDAKNFEWLVVDPLDGSNNHALGLPGYGFMAARVGEGGRIIGSAIVLPEFNQYLVFENGRQLNACPVGSYLSGSSPVYYAYPPKQSDVARRARFELQNLIDTRSAGLYRYGSACVGLYNLLCGKHKAFIGHGIRIWDALAFLPFLALQNIEIRYRIAGLSITVLASWDADFLSAMVDILEGQEQIKLHRYCLNDILEVHAS